MIETSPRLKAGTSRPYPPNSGETHATVPTPPDVDALFDEALQHGRLAEQASQASKYHLSQRSRAVAALRAAGVSYGRIAKKLGVSRSMVQYIVRPFDGRPLGR